MEVTGPGRVMAVQRSKAGMAAFEAFSWQSRKRTRDTMVLQGQGDLAAAFHVEEALEDEYEEEAPAPSKLRGMHLEDAPAKCKRLNAEGALLAESERYAEALKRWEDALLFAANPDEQGALYEQMAQVLLLLARSFDAVRAASRAAELRPHWHCAFLTLGRAQLEFGEFELALKSLRQAVNLAPEDEDATEELREAEEVWARLRTQATSCSKRGLAVNGRVVETRFWETALCVSYDSEGRPTTHYPLGGEPPESDAGHGVR